MELSIKARLNKILSLSLGHIFQSVNLLIFSSTIFLVCEKVLFWILRLLCKLERVNDEVKTFALRCFLLLCNFKSRLLNNYFAMNVTFLCEHYISHFLIEKIKSKL